MSFLTSHSCLPFTPPHLLGFFLRPSFLAFFRTSSKFPAFLHICAFFPSIRPSFLPAFRPSVLPLSGLPSFLHIISVLPSVLPLHFSLPSLPSSFPSILPSSILSFLPQAGIAGMTIVFSSIAFKLRSASSSSPRPAAVTAPSPPTQAQDPAAKKNK